MKKFNKKIFFVILILIVCLTLVTACGDKDNGNGGETDNITPNDGTNSGGEGDNEPELKAWQDPKFVFFGNDIITWGSDSNADSYHILLDGIDYAATGNEYFKLTVSTNKEYDLRIAKCIDGEYYYSEIMKWSPETATETYIRSMEELNTTFYQNGAYQLGSIKYNSIVLDLSSSTENTLPFQNTIKVGTMLDKLTIKCNGQTALSSFGIEIEERTRPLTIIFDNVTLSTLSRSNMVYYSGTTSFETTIITKNSCTFANSTTGTNGSDGHSASGISSAGNGSYGGNGGNIFSLPKVKFFTERQPDFVTGNGGKGGNGGVGSYGAHGGYGGNGGNGGYVFERGEVAVFNTNFRVYSGNFGNGGSGGKGGSGISGTRSGGSSGAQGSFASSSVTLTYLSRRDGINHTIVDDDENGFEVSYVNNYLVWVEQPKATGYKIMKDGTVFAECVANTYYVSPDKESTLFSGKVSIVPIYPDGVTGVFDKSATVKIYHDANAVTVTEVSGTIEGSSHIKIPASLITSAGEIKIGADVKRITIYNDKGSGKVRITASLVANARGDNLIIDLINVTVVSSISSSYAAITFNDGNGASDGSSPMLIINSENSQILGADGKAGADGAYRNDGHEGGNGGNGGNGKTGIEAAYVAFMGSSITVSGGNGGKGGNGGGASLNNGGDGGNGGNGGKGLICSMLYVIMNEENSAAVIYASQGGAGGERGDGFGNLMDSSRPGSNGSGGASISGNYRKYIGALNC